VNIKKILKKAAKVFGFVYFVCNTAALTVFVIMAIYTMIQTPQFSLGWVLLIFPILGMLTGYWIRTGKYGWVRISIIVVSLIIFVIALFIALVVAPKIEKAAHMISAEQDTFAHPASVLDPDIQPIFYAVYNNDAAGLDALIQKGADINLCDHFGQSLLHITQNKDIADMLIAAGADVNAKDFDYQMTPIFNKDIEIAKLLVEAGADVNARGKNGNTPLMWYCYSGYLDGVKYMVSLGADVNVKNADNQTAYDIAETFGHLDLLEYLKSIGAKPGKEEKREP